MKFAQDIILKPIVTEHSMSIMRDQRKYTFVVAKDANKIEIKKAAEELIKVEVESVNTMNMRGKNKRMGYTHGKTAAFKKAIITLTEKSKTIEFFDSLMNRSDTECLQRVLNPRHLQEDRCPYLLLKKSQRLRLRNHFLLFSKRTQVETATVE